MPKQGKNQQQRKNRITFLTFMFSKKNKPHNRKNITTRYNKTGKDSEAGKD